ncbi:MAG: DUF3108 domain-containing protein [Micropepsaceae bacterium]
MKKPILAAVIAIASIGAGHAVSPVPRPPAPEYTVKAVYNVSLLGLSVGQMQLELTLKGGAYEAKVYVEPRGLASTFTSNTVSAVATGLGQLGQLQPTYSWIQQFSTKRTQTVTMRMEAGAAPDVTAEPVYENIENPATDAQKAGAVDPVGGLLSMILLPGAGPGDKACGESITIFDGKRLYAFDMWSDGTKDVKRGAGGYAGPALYCVASYRRIAGWGDKYMARKSDSKVEAYFAPIGKGADGGPAFYLPVRLWSDAEVGDVVAIPASVTINGKDWGTFFAEGG